MTKRREPVNVEERVGPTPETLAKLVPDPIKRMFDAGQISIEHTEAAAEIRAIWFAITGNLFARAHDYDNRGGRSVLPDWIAEAHHSRYVPWCKEMGWRLPLIMDCLLEGKELGAPVVVFGLSDYAARMGTVKSRHTIMTEARV